MSDLKDFVIKNGKLLEYVGSGGDVAIPEGITTIGKEAFYRCSNLESVTMPTSVKKIEKYAFYGTSLKTVIIPDGVESIEYSAFCDCSNLSNVFIPKSITIIKSFAFYNCSNLTNVNLVGVSTVEWHAFANCKSLAKITFPPNYIDIGDGAFHGCNSLADDNGFIIVNNVLYDYIGVDNNITVPDGVVAISFAAFRDNTNLTSVCIPDSVTSIGREAFFGCSNLESVILPSKVSYIGYGAFECCKALTHITIPKGLTRIEESVFKSCSILNTITIPENITEIGPRAFEYNDALANVTIDGNVTKMGVSVFGGCSIKSVFAPNVALDVLKKQQLSLAATAGFFTYREKFIDDTVVAEYEKYTISQKKNLLPLFFENDIVEGISFYANAGKITIENFDDEFFYPAQAAKASQCIAFLVNWKNENISQEAIENNLEKQIDKNPFNVTDVKKVWSYKKLKDGTLSITGYKGNAVNITIPERIGKDIVTEIGDEAFSATKDHSPKVTTLVMENIQSIIIPETIKSIGVEAFGCCTSLTEIIMPDSITKIGDYAFRYCTSLTKVTLPAKIRKIGVAAFEECHNLNEITVPYRVKKIGEDAFWRCNNLTNVNISDSVSTIDINAFGGCPVTIHAPAGSYAEQYAKENNIHFVAE